MRLLRPPPLLAPIRCIPLHRFVASPLHRAWRRHVPPAIVRRRDAQSEFFAQCAKVRQTAAKVQGSVEGSEARRGTNEATRLEVTKARAERWLDLPNPPPFPDGSPDSDVSKAAAKGAEGGVPLPLDTRRRDSPPQPCHDTSRGASVRESMLASPARDAAHLPPHGRS